MKSSIAVFIFQNGNQRRDGQSCIAAKSAQDPRDIVDSVHSMAWIAWVTGPQQRNQERQCLVSIGSQSYECIEREEISRFLRVFQSRDKKRNLAPRLGRIRPRQQMTGQ